MVKALLISRGAKVREALRQLEEAESKTLFVTSDDQTLYGTLTDGDVRRWILSGSDLDGLVDDVCNKRPYAVSADYDADVVRREMLQRNINCVPVVGTAGQIIDVLLWEKMFAEEVSERAPLKSINVPVVIMAGGKGTRLAPFTSVLPKPLIPLGEKTVIETIVDGFRAYVVDTFYLSVNYKSKIIKSYFEELEPPYSVNYIYEDQPLGTAGSLYALAGKIASDIVLTNCDVIIHAD